MNQDPINNGDLDGRMNSAFGGGTVSVGGVYIPGGRSLGRTAAVAVGAAGGYVAHKIASWIWHSQHGKKNVEHSHHVGVSDEDLKQLLVDPLTDSIEKAKIRQTLKGRGQRRSRQNRDNKR